MDLELGGRRALVTGSSGGIGRAIAARLAAEGCAVLLHGRDRGRTEAAAAELGGEAVVGDLLDGAQAARVAERARAWGADVLVNNAGPFSENDVEAGGLEEWTTALDGNVHSAVRMIRALVPGMRERGWGRVIGIGSRAATTPLPHMAAYSAAKAAVLNLTTGLARHLAGTGVTANTVSPGVIVTGSLRQMFADGAAARGRPSAWPELEPLVTEEYAPNPAGRLGTPEDIAAAVAFLASPLAGYVNGTELRVDGGIVPVA
ncbi:short-chain dehydrogenase [Mangrovactinospora gilvigrisea]|uniref:Short-chain dehydrogenase n=1 Tax=Mangrovactinospora gilvigrisea TaxID=1428644 RepID=A0A1J7C429_9ACTN|nr:SDR family oxidoreductase [Mangrovactinospora gilvigrisea]OIV36324.1 short-chain dehydrogenase [Mangrovactinospora gilvigrisea]